MKPERGGGNVLLGFRTSFTGTKKTKKNKKANSQIFTLVKKTAVWAALRTEDWLKDVQRLRGAAEIKTIPTKKLMEGP